MPVDPNRHVCAKGLTILGIGGEVLSQYGPSLRMLARHRGRLPLDALISDRVALEDVGDALQRAQTGAAAKILVAPNGSA